MSRVVLVCGGRTYGDRTGMTQELAKLQPTKIVHRAANRADGLAGVSARARQVVVYRAEWAKYGRSARPRRNAVMLERELPDVVIACRGGAGTADTVRRAKSAGIRVIEVAA